MTTPIRWSETRKLDASVKTPWGRFWVEIWHTKGLGDWCIEVQALGRGFAELGKREARAQSLREAKVAAVALMLQMDETCVRLSELNDGHTRAKAELLGSPR